MPTRPRLSPSLLIAIVAAAISATPRAAKAVEFDRVVIDNDFPGAYQVEVADVNGDKRPDVVAVGGGTCAWYENPTWKKRIVTGPKQTPGIISSATADLDGDGKAEIAIAYEFEMNEPTKGKLLLAVQGKTPKTPGPRRRSPTSGASIGSAGEAFPATSTPIGDRSLRRRAADGPRRRADLRPVGEAPGLRPGAGPRHALVPRGPTRNRAGGSAPLRRRPRSCTRSTWSTLDGDSDVLGASNLGVTDFTHYRSSTQHLRPIVRRAPSYIP